MPDRFTGFPRDAVAFLHELTFEMNRTWFEANKARYQRVWVEPLTALLGAVAGKLARAYDAPLTPKVFRIHRDTRFSKDKSPYKTHVAGVIHAGGAAALYLHVGTDEEYVGAGIYYFEDAQLPRWRKLVAADKTGAEVAAHIAKLRRRGFTVGGHDDYKKVPKGFAPDHPRADLLRMRGLTAGFPAMPRGLLFKPALANWLATQAKLAAPLVGWLAARVR